MRGSRRARLGLSLALLCATAAAAHAATARGIVFLDRDGDGVFSAGDTPLVGAHVWFDTLIDTTTDAGGAYALAIPDDAAGQLWVSVPEAGRPGPVWASIDGAADAVRADLAVRPAPGPPSRRFRFVIASDAHIGGASPQWTPDELARVLGQALALPEPARFVTISGDITQTASPADFAAADRGLAAIDTPWVPVPGNHDWYDGGPAYRAHWGPDQYSFTTGGVHVVVWNSNRLADDVLRFIQDDLRDVPASTTVIAIAHIPPRDDLAAGMRAAGVDYLFTGHWHANQRMVRGGLIELGTQTLLTGGIDLSPAGYRVVTVDDGVVTTRHHTVVDAPVVALMWPPTAGCASPDGTLIASAEGGGAETGVTATVDGHPLALAPGGGWTWSGSFAGLADGPHQVTLALDGAHGVLAERRATIQVCRDAPDGRGLSREGAWLEHQGDAGHHGRSSTALDPPLVPIWTAAVGGHLHLGAPVVADGRVFVSVSDLGDGDHGGVTAFELGTGARLWSFATATPVHHAPAISGHTVIVATTTATVTGLDAATGARKWTVDLAAGFDATETALWAPPTVDGGVVYVGHQHRVVALDGDTGAVRWSASNDDAGDTSGSCAALAVDHGDVFGAFHRNSGLTAWHLPDPALRWRVVDTSTLGINGAIVVDGDRVYAGNSLGTMSAFDRRTGERRWQASLVDANDWAYAIAGSPALADGRLFVPTQWGRFVALDAATGAELWSYDARPGPLRTAHTRGHQPGFLASPLVADDTVWIADTSGLLVALDVRTGARRWQLDLGMPVLGGLAIAGDYLLVTTWDGTLHALAPARRLAGPGRGRVAIILILLLLPLALLAAELVVATAAARSTRSARPGRAGGGR